MEHKKLIEEFEKEKQQKLQELIQMPFEKLYAIKNFYFQLRGLCRHRPRIGEELVQYPKLFFFIIFATYIFQLT